MISDFDSYVTECKAGARWHNWILLFYLQQSLPTGTFAHQIVSRANRHLNRPYVSTVEQYCEYIDRPIEERLANKERDRKYRERSALAYAGSQAAQAAGKDVEK